MRYWLRAAAPITFLTSMPPAGSVWPEKLRYCQRSKRAFLADKMYRYDAQHYLVLSVPLLFSAETEATSEEPLLGLAIRLDVDMVAQIAGVTSAGQSPPSGIISKPIDASLAESTLRLLEVLSDPLEAKVLVRRGWKKSVFAC